MYCALSYKTDLFSYDLVHLIKQQLLKVVGNEKWGGLEAGYCMKMVLDRVDRCLFAL